MGISSSIIVARNQIEVLGSKLLCAFSEGGLTAKKIILGWNANIWGKVVVPNSGILSMRSYCQIDKVVVGANVTIKAEDSLEIGALIILGPDVTITLGENCLIRTIESDNDFRLSAGKSFSNPLRLRLRRKYNLILEISGLIKQALSLE